MAIFGFPKPTFMNSEQDQLEKEGGHLNHLSGQGTPTSLCLGF